MKMKILLVDDEKDIVEFLEYNLIQEGFEVITAYNGMEALKKLSEKPDLVILDIMMPQLNGYDVCKKIRSLPEFRQTPVIFLTVRPPPRSTRPSISAIWSPSWTWKTSPTIP